MSLLWAPAFKTAHQEARFAVQQAALNRRLDKLTGLACFSIFVFSLLRFGATWAAFPQPLLAGLLCLVPTMWCSLLGVPSYDRHRLWVVSGKLCVGIQGLMGSGLGPAHTCDFVAQKCWHLL